MHSPKCHQVHRWCIYVKSIFIEDVKQLSLILDGLRWGIVGRSASAREMHLVSLWPWPLTVWPSNLISSSLSQTAPRLTIWWNSHKRFIRYRANKRLAYKYKCSLDNAKKSFYRAASSVFGKIGRIASEEVTLQIMDSKCIPMLLYGFEACPSLVEVRQIISLDFAIDRFFMKLFQISSINIVRLCQSFFNFELPSIRWEKRCKI